MATKPLLTQLLTPGVLPGLPATSLTSLGGVEVARRVRAGEPADVVVLASGAITGLAADGLVRPDTVRPLFRSEVVVAVRQGGAAPDVSTVEALREALLAADRIGYSTGPSGDGLLALLDRWGLRERLQARLVRAEPGLPVGRLLADGRAVLGFQQRSELERAPGVRVLGPLPPDAQIVTIFTGAVLTGSAEPADAESLLARLAEPDVGPVARRHGLDLAGAAPAARPADGQ